MPRAARNLLLALVVLMLLGAALVAGTNWKLRQPGPLAQPAIVFIPAGSSVRGMAAKLEAAGVIESAMLFEGIVRATGQAPNLKAGEYLFEKNLSVYQVIAKLVKGLTAQRMVTVPEGHTVKQALAILQKAPGLKGEARPIPEEGTIFPDTYGYTAGQTRAEVIKAMTERGKAELDAAWAQRAGALPYKDATDMLIMASIVEKEAAHVEEMPQIAAVFVNRLKKGMRLQADPTVIYGAELDGNDLKTRDMREPHPFNTYLNDGLPPTPIANPGRAALQAAANPAQTDVLFFVAKPDRTGHVFTTTYAEHQKAVKAYWNQRDKEAKQSKQEAAKAASPTTPSKAAK
jgi:UPF0755 protein